MQVIAILPALLSLYYSFTKSPTQALLTVYLPVLILIPDGFRLFVGGLPDLGFQHAAILPILLAVVMQRLGSFRLCLTDWVVLGFVFTLSASQLQATSINEAQNILFDQGSRIFLPYFLVRILIEHDGFRVAFAKRLVVLLAIVAVLSIWQFRLGSNPFFREIWGPFFPDQAPPRTTGYRMGFARITGPFTHAILAGVIFGSGVFVQSWLHGARKWRSRRTSWLLLGAVCLGSFMTMSRGPWMGIAVGGCIASLGHVRNRGSGALKLVAAALLLGVPALMALNEYMSVGLKEAASYEQATAAYRLELLDVYLPAVMQKPLLGWGMWRWEAVRAYRSIDNHYLLLALNHGLLAVGLLVGSMLWVGGRLCAAGWRLPARNETAMLAFTLAGAILATGFSIATVWAGAQTLPILFMLIGWGEGIVQAQSHWAWSAQPRPFGRPMGGFAR